MLSCQIMQLKHKDHWSSAASANASAQGNTDGVSEYVTMVCDVYWGLGRSTSRIGSADKLPEHVQLLTSEV